MAENDSGRAGRKKLYIGIIVVLLIYLLYIWLT